MFFLCPTYLPYKFNNIDSAKHQGLGSYNLSLLGQTVIYTSDVLIHDTRRIAVFFIFLRENVKIVLVFKINMKKTREIIT